MILSRFCLEFVFNFLRNTSTSLAKSKSCNIFLTASAEARADRRFKELQEKGQDVAYEVILKEIKERDYQDMNRATAPLKQAEDAVLVDTTKIDLEESIALMINTIKERL